MNNRTQNTKALHDPRHALDAYVDNLINIEDSCEEQALSGFSGNQEHAVNPAETKQFKQDIRFSEFTQDVDRLPNQESGVDKENFNEESESKEKQESVESVADSTEEISESPVTDSHAATGISTVDKQNTQIAQPVFDEETGCYLQFQVAGLMLAIEQSVVCDIYPWSSQMSATVASSEWLLGKADFSGYKVRILDVGNLIIPKSRQIALRYNSKVNTKHFIVFGDGTWGLACDKVFGMVNFPYSEIRWRSEQGQRPWLAGTVINQKCALIDVDAVIQMLEDEN